MKSLIIAAGALALSSTFAFADVVCNEEGDCWRTRGRAEYRPELRLRVHPDNWRWEERDGARYRWREAGPKHGYWQKGVWIELRD